MFISSICINKMLIKNFLFLSINWLIFAFISEEIETLMTDDLQKSSSLDQLNNGTLTSNISHMMEKILTPPECVRGMVELDKSKFNKTIRVPLMSVKISLINSIVTALRKYLLRINNFNVVTAAANEDKKSIHLNPELVKNFHSFEKNTQKLLRKYMITEKDLTFKEMTIGYDNFSAHDIINAIIPSSYSFAGFTTIGKIIHLNLKEHLLPYKKIIGQILLEKIKTCESVVNKLNEINTTFRTFEMEVLAGSEDLQTVVKENGCKFELDFRTVYWNSKLCEEHYEITCKINEGDVLYDVFCGIGPFAIPVAKNGSTVLANDANENCCKYLLRNRNINKVKPNLLSVFNKDGAAFIKEDIKADMLRRARTFKKEHPYKIHITMNLPAIAHTFLTNFVGLFNKHELSTYPDELLPIVYVYCFIKDKEKSSEKAKQLVQDTLNFNIDDAEVSIVRNVAPNKEMLRVSFTLSKEILGCEKRKITNFGDHIEMKKPRMENVDSEINDVEMN